MSAPSCEYHIAVAKAPEPVVTVGRYVIYGEIGSGGMATVHFGKLFGSAGFSRIVAIKRMRPQFATDQAFVRMFIDEAMMAVRVRHPNVVPTLDVLSANQELILVLEYVQGETLGQLMRTAADRGETIPPGIVAAIIAGVLHGLHAAHEATDEQGRRLGIVHRDVSAKNVIVGIDGIPRVFDFGVAKAKVRYQSTRGGQLKGTLSYMAPERFKGGEATHLVDIYACGVMMWRALTLEPLFNGGTEAEVLAKILTEAVSPPSKRNPAVPPELDKIVLTALSREPSDRYQTAQEMALALEHAVPLVRPLDLGEWVRTMAGDTLRMRATKLADIESSDSVAQGVIAQNGLLASNASQPTTRSTVHAVPGTTEARAPKESTEDSSSSTSRKRLKEESSSRKKAVHISRILVIDDSEVVLERIRRVLEREGYEVMTTTRTVGNARYLASSDLVLIDYHMPGLDGGSVVESLRAAVRDRSTKCLLYLCTTDKSLTKRYADLGFDGCIADKSDLEALVRQVKAALRLVRMREMRSD